MKARNSCKKYLKMYDKGKGWSADSLAKILGKIILRTDMASVDHDQYLYEGIMAKEERKTVNYGR